MAGDGYMTKKLCFGFAVLEISFWSFHASFMGFVSAYLLSKGMSNTFLSILIAVYLFTAFIGSFVWGIISDKYNTNKKVLMIELLGSGILMYFLYFNGGNTGIVALVYPLLGFLVQPLASNVDSWLISSCKGDAQIYGKIRSMPSLVYAFIAVILGKMIASYGYHFMLLGGTFFLGTALLTAQFLPDKAVAEPSGREKLSKASIRQLLSVGSYRQLIVILFLIGVSIAPLNNLKVVLLNNVGGNVSDIGIDSFFGALTQVPFIALAGRTQKLSLRFRYLLMTGLPLCAFLAALFAHGTYMIFFATFLLNVGYGILLPTMREVTEMNVPSKLRNLGHNLSEAVYNSFSGMISLVYSGIVIDYFGIHIMLMICIAIIAISVFISCFSHHYEK